MTRPSHPIDPAIYTRRRVLIAAAFTLPVVAFTQLRGSDTRSSAPSPSAPTPPGSILSSVSRPPAKAAEAVLAPVAATTDPELGVLEFDHDVGLGATGTKVAAIQTRLRKLRFDPGPADSVFGPATQRAVWAFEKFILGTAPEVVTGVVTSDMWGRFNEDIAVRPRRTGPGTHMEILLSQQVAIVYANDLPTLITHISSGSGEQWCDVVAIDNDDGTKSEEGICGIAITPGGVFRFERRIEGWRNSKLGRLYNPVYFNYGIAVHGASNVPKFPASHGCVRIPMHIAEYFQTLVDDGDYVYVFDGIKQPETYGAQLPVFDYPDPNQTTTTMSA